MFYMSNKDYCTGDLLEVTCKDGLKFKCIVIENYEGGFVSRVLSKDEGIKTASWSRYGLNKSGRFQVFDDCSKIERLAYADKKQGTATLSLNESLIKSNITYYTTPVNNTESITFCVYENYGGWSTIHKGNDPDSLKESFFNSQLSKLNNLPS